MDRCKLTLKEGKFVKSHILPKALTKPRISGAHFVQPSMLSVGHKYIKRNDSWFDKDLTIRYGEDILSDLDSFGIEQLRKNGLVWSSTKRKFFDTLPNLSIVCFEQPKKMRLFFLSLLWRAAATKLDEFRAIQIPSQQLEKIRKVLTGEDKDKRSLYPMILVNLATEGHTHNLAPIESTIDCVQKGYGKNKIFRFYMNGLIIHFYIEDPSLFCLSNPIPYDSPMYVGEEQTLVTHVDYEDSFQFENLKKHSAVYRKHLNNSK